MKQSAHGEAKRPLITMKVAALTCAFRCPAIFVRVAHKPPGATIGGFNGVFSASYRSCSESRTSAPSIHLALLT